MKKAVSLVLALILCLALLTACGNKETTEENSIIGTWVADTEALLAAVPEYESLKDALPEGTEFDFKITFTFTETEVTLYMNAMGVEDTETAVYTYADNKLTIEENTVDCVIEGNKMTMDMSEMEFGSLVFTKQ